MTVKELKDKLASLPTICDEYDVLLEQNIDDNNEIEDWSGKIEYEHDVKIVVLEVDRGESN